MGGVPSPWAQNEGFQHLSGDARVPFAGLPLRHHLRRARQEWALEGTGFHVRRPGDGTLQADACLEVLRSRMDGFVSPGCTVRAEMLGTFHDFARDFGLLVWPGVHSLDHRQDLLCFYMPRSPLGPDHWLCLHELHGPRA